MIAVAVLGVVDAVQHLAPHRQQVSICSDGIWIFLALLISAASELVPCRRACLYPCHSAVAFSLWQVQPDQSGK